MDVWYKLTDGSECVCFLLWQHPILNFLGIGKCLSYSEQWYLYNFQTLLNCDDSISYRQESTSKFSKWDVRLILVKKWWVISVFMGNGVNYPVTCSYGNWTLAFADFHPQSGTDNTIIEKSCHLPTVNTCYGHLIMWPTIIMWPNMVGMAEG